MENNKRLSYRIERKAAWETGQVCILSILPGKSPRHVTCQSPIVTENWSLSDVNQNKHLGVIISFQVGD